MSHQVQRLFQYLVWSYCKSTVWLIIIIHEILSLTWFLVIGNVYGVFFLDEIEEQLRRISLQHKLMGQKTFYVYCPIPFSS